MGSESMLISRRKVKRCDVSLYTINNPHAGSWCRKGGWLLLTFQLLPPLMLSADTRVAAAAAWFTVSL